MSVVTGLTIEEFLDGDFPAGAELISGEVVVNDPRFDHQAVALLIVRRLADWVDSPDGRGATGFGGNWTIAPGHVLKPDVWWALERPSGARADRVPDLAVEIRSPGNWRYDIGPKYRICEAAGLRELWLVDPPGGVVLVYRRSTPEAKAFDIALEVAEPDVLTTPLLAGFALPVAEVLNAAN